MAAITSKPPRRVETAVVAALGVDVVWVRTRWWGNSLREGFSLSSKSSKSSKINDFFTPKHVRNFTKIIFYSHSLKSKNSTKNQIINVKLSSLKAIGNYNV